MWAEVGFTPDTQEPQEPEEPEDPEQSQLDRIEQRIEAMLEIMMAFKNV